jgi:hypothetical protein
METQPQITKEKGKFKDLFESVTGNETAEQLNDVAEKINNYYKKLTLGDFIKGHFKEDNPHLPINPEDESSSILECNIIDIYRSLRKDELSLADKDLVLNIFHEQDVFQSLISEVSCQFRAMSAEKLGALLYLCYQIKNPFRLPSQQAIEITDMAYKKTQAKNESINCEGPVLERISAMVDEFFLASIYWKSAWSYFGQERSSQFLEILLSDKYGDKLFNDLKKFAEESRLICPPQIFSILKNAGDITNPDIRELFKEIYDTRATSLHELASKGGLNYQITGLERATEYPNMAELIPEDFKEALYVSLGGAVGIIEIERAKELGLKGPIIIVDKAGKKQSIENSLVLRNELVYTTGNPCLSQKEIQDIIDSSPCPVYYLQTNLPMAEDTLNKFLSANDISKYHKVVIMDQRASALYLKGQNLLDSINSSVSLLRENKGVYFLTRGLGDRLFMDIVIEIGDEELAFYRYMHHTSGFTERDITGFIHPANSSQLIGNGKAKNNKMTQSQTHKETEEFSINKKINALRNIIKLFSTRFNHPIEYKPDGIDYSEILVMAYAQTENFPISMNSDDFKNKPEPYYYVIGILADLLKKVKEPNPNLEIEIQSTKEILGRHADREKYSSFFKTVDDFLDKMSDSPDVFIEMIKYFDEKFSNAGDLIFRIQSKAIATPTERFLDRESSDFLITQFIDKFYSELHLAFISIGTPEVGSYTNFVLAAIFSLYNINSKHVLTYVREAPGHLAVIEEIKNKILALNNGKDYKFDFSQVKAIPVLDDCVKTLETIDKKVWLNLIKITTKYFKAGSIHAV